MESFVQVFWKTGRKSGEIEIERGVILSMVATQLGISLPSNSFTAGRRPLRWLVQLEAISADHPSSPQIPPSPSTASLITPKVSALSALLPLSYGTLVCWCLLQKCHHKKGSRQIGPLVSSPVLRLPLYCRKCGGKLVVGASGSSYSEISIQISQKL